jgi:transcriptional regulator CtsR
MARIIDEIELYIRRLLEQSSNGIVDLQRADVADRFDCVPSQVTYVLMTRFTPDRGFLVEGRRGGGGGIRVHQLNAAPQELLDAINQVESIDQARALDIVFRLFQASLISEREASLMRAVLHRDTIQLDLPYRDRVRARLLKAMVTAILKPEGA